MKAMKIYQWKSSLFYEEISPTAKLIGIAIAEFYRDGKECYPSLPTIMELTGHTSINTVRKAIDELKDNQLLDVKQKVIKGRGGRPVNSYVFLGLTEQLSKNDSSVDSSNDSSVDSSVDISKSDSEVTEDTEVTNTTEVVIKKDTKVSKKRGSRFDFKIHVDERWYNEAKRIKPDFQDQDIQAEMESFNDYWTGVPGSKGLKLDWIATWRNWLRNSKRRPTYLSNRKPNYHNPASTDAPF